MYRDEKGETVMAEDEAGIKDGAFAGCNTMKSMVIPEGVSVIGTAAFRGCDALARVVLPESVTVIRGKAFHGCRALTGVTIPEYVTMIGAYAFGGCNSLEAVWVEARIPPIIGEAVFDATVPGFGIRVPDGSVAVYKMVWREYEDYIVAY